MKKTLLYFTAASALVLISGAALADSGNVEIYGTLNADFENMKATGGNQIVAFPAVPGVTFVGVANPVGAAQPSRNKVTSNSSNVGFRGYEDLGLGLQAWFQVESQANIDSGSTFWSSRNTAIGLKSNKLGTIFYGQWDLPAKYYANSIDAWWATSDAASNAILGTPGFNVATTTQGGRAGGVGPAGAPNAADASFDRRQGNSVQYWTPDIFGFTARLAYSANEQRAAEPSTAANPNINPTIYGLGLQYQLKGLRVMYTFEQHRDYFGLSAIAGATALPTNGTDTTSRDNENKAIVSYKFAWEHFGSTTLSGAWERLSYNNSDSVAAHVNHFGRDAIYVTLLHEIGPWTLRGGVGDAHSGSCTLAGGAGCSAGDTGALNFTFGGSYDFSKRTQVYLFYARMNNGTYADYALGNGNTPTSTAVPGGSHIQSIALGMRHSF
ncbi:MAG TPA: porin [Burkholderiales bacterium]|nr:porin [Burkholderiales bacterium]